MTVKAIVVLCTCPNLETANKLAHFIIESKLAACVNTLPNITSTYSWQGKIETSNEILLLIKTTESSYLELESVIKNHHPYECPEIIGLPIEQGFTGYLQWIKDTVRAN